MIDIIIPAYLPEEKYLFFLNRALSSLEQQTYENFKVHLVLNGLYANKEEIIPKIKYTKNIAIHDMNGKASGAKARNFGIKNSKEKYIAYIDADDQYMPQKLEKQIEFLEKNETVDVLGTRTFYLKDNIIYPPKFSETQFETHEQIKNTIKYDNIMFHGSLMFRREIFEKNNFYYNEEQKPGIYWPQYGRPMWEDWDLWMRMIDGGVRFHTLKDALYIWSLGTSVET